MIPKIKTASNFSVSLETVASELPTGMLIFDADENVVYANPAAKTLFGSYPSASGYFHCVDFLACRNGDENPDGCGHSPECSDCFMLRAVRSTLTDKDANTAGETKIERCSGRSPLWIKYQARPLDLNGQRLALLFIDDITVYKQTEESLRRSEAKFRDLFNNLPVGLYQTTLDGKIVDANPACLAICGCPETERDAWLAQDTKQSYVRPEDAEQLREHLLKKGRIHAFEAPFKKWDGSVAWLSNSARLVTDDEGGAVAIFGCFVDVTERKRAETKLEDSERRYRFIAEHTSDGIILLENDTIAFASPSYMNILGYPESAEIGRTKDEILELIHPDDRHGVLHIIINAVQNGLPEALYTYRARNYEGHYMWREDHARFIYGSDGKHEKTVVVCRNIDDKMKSKIALQEANSLLEGVLDAIPDIVGIQDSNFRILRYNRAGYKALNLTYEEVAGNTCFSLIGRKTPCEICATSLAVKNKTLESVERYIPELGRYFLCRSNPIFNDNGKLLFVVEQLQDISHRKKAENEIKIAKDFLETAIAQSPSGILIADAPDVTIRMANKAALDIRGANSGLITGIDFTKHAAAWQTFRLDGSPYPSEELPLSRAVLKGKVTEDEELIIRDDTGNKKWVKVNAAPIYDEQGQITAGIVIFHDITGQKMLEEDKRQLEKSIQHAQKMEAVGSLAAGIAHDFNNLLFPIIGMSELLLEDLPPGSTEHENAQEIMNAGKRGGDLVKQILAFSRQTEHQMIPVRVQQVLKEVLKLCRSSIPAEIEITQNLQPDCGLVLADPTQVHQVAMNLITNAYHACEITSGTIHVSVRQVDIGLDDLKGKSLDPGPHVLLTVEDTACGIDPEVLDKIFEPYFTTKEVGKGTGLGLATVYGIVKEHQGDIMVDSEPGRGTMFTVYLPLMEPSADADTPAASSGPVIGGSERILIVDDDDIVGRLEQQMLDRLGYRTTVRASSIEALEAFKAAPRSFDLVITDMSMPRLTGDRLAREMLAVRPDIPVVICTGFSERINHKKAKSMGLAGFLMKPVIGSELARIVRQVLDDARSRSRQGEQQ